MRDQQNNSTISASRNEASDQNHPDSNISGCKVQDTKARNQKLKYLSVVVGIVIGSGIGTAIGLSIRYA